MGNTSNGPVKNGDEHHLSAHSREELSSTPPTDVDFPSESSFISILPNENLSITSPIQFESPDGVKFDVNNVSIEDYDLVTNYEEFLVS